MIDYYAVLEVSRDATFQEIRDKYRREAMRWHADQNRSDPLAEKKFKDISEAYTILSSSERRADLDRFLSQSASAKQSSQKENLKGTYSYQNAASVFFDEMFQLGVELTMQNEPWFRIAATLVERGCPDEMAYRIAHAVERRRKAVVRKQASGLLIRAGFSFFGGLILFGVLFEFGFIAFAGPILMFDGVTAGGRALRYLKTGTVPVS